MKENSKYTEKMTNNLHPNLEEASGMAPKMRMFEELRKMEHERRTRVEMERVQQEENERRERRRQREILEDERKKQRWEEDRIRQGETSIEVAKQALARKHLEREKLEEEEDVEEVCLMRGKNLPKTGQNTQSQAKHAWVNQNIDDENFTEVRVKTSGSTAVTPLCSKKHLENRKSEPVKEEELRDVVKGEAKEGGDALQDEEEDVAEVCLVDAKNLPETSRNTRSECPLSVVEIPEEATEEPLANKKDLNVKQKAFNWLNKKVKKRTLQKIERTYKREAEEGFVPYLPLMRAMVSMPDGPLPTRAERERAKREKLLEFEEQRQQFEDRWNQTQAKRAERKEARKLKEEERYERWNVRRCERLNENVSDDEHCMEDMVETSGSTTAKKRMTFWQKRFLRFKGLMG